VGHDLAPDARLDWLLAEEQPHAPDRDEVPVPEGALAHAVAVDDRAVGRAAVAQEELAPAVLDHGVPPRDHGVGEHQVVGGIAADGQDRGAGERDLAAVRGGRVHDQACHL
jgi:hypothetical protein